MDDKRIDDDNIEDLITDVPVEVVEEGTTNMVELISDMPIDDDVDGDLAKEIKNRRIQMINFGEDFEKWDPAASFSGEGDFFFIVIQSTSGASVEDIKRKVHACIGLDL